jgi:glycosyltransferase involved in cell wall biosynthesis
MPLITVVTPLFPMANHPYRGRFIYETVLGLQRYADVQVLCPIAVYPAWATVFRPRLPTRVDTGYSPPGVNATYFSYPALPLVSRPWNGAICRRRLYPHLEKSRPAVVLSYWLYPEGYAAVRASHALGIPAIVGCRGSDLRIPDPLTGWLVAKTLREADYVLTVSRELHSLALRLGASGERSASILNGCDSKVFHPTDREAARGQLGIVPGEKVILYVGRFVKAKGIPELTAAFTGLQSEFPELRLVCIGSGPLKRDMESLAHTAKRSDRILMPGVQSPPEVARWMAAADLFCLPSHSEGCPNVVIEAISCGCPVVASDVGGIPELVNPECGILVPAEDVARLTEALRAGLTRAWDREAIHSMFSRTWDNVAQETYATCQRFMNLA